MHPSDSETFCLKWNDFIDNVTTSFAQLRKEKDFADVTLAPGDGGQTVVKAHRVVLASGSHVLKSLLTQHPSENPLIFMRGMKQDQLNSIVDFLYFGEVSIHQDELNDFLALAEELQLKGLTESKNKETSKSTVQEIKRESISGAPHIVNNQQFLGGRSLENQEIFSLKVDKAQVKSQWSKTMLQTNWANLGFPLEMEMTTLKMKSANIWRGYKGLQINGLALHVERLIRKSILRSTLKDIISKEGTTPVTTAERTSGPEIHCKDTCLLAIDRVLLK